MENATPAPEAAGKKKSNTGLIAGIIAGVVAIVGIVLAIVLIAGAAKGDPVVGKYEAYSTIKDGKEETASISLMKAFGMTITIEFKEDGTGEMVTSADGSVFSSSEEGEDSSSAQSKEVATFKWKDGKITDMKGGTEGEEAKSGTYEYVKEKVDDKDTEFVLVSMTSSEGSEEKVKFKRIVEEKK